MTPGATLGYQSDESDALVILKSAIRAIPVAAAFGAFTVGFDAFVDNQTVNRLDGVSASFEMIVRDHKTVQASYAGGVASGLLIGGDYVPQDLLNRVADIVETDVIESSRVLRQARESGLEAALSGGWDVDRLEEYVTRIERDDADLRELLSQQTERLVETGVERSYARSVLRAMTVNLMSGEEPEDFRSLSWDSSTVNEERAEVLQLAQDRIRSHIKGTHQTTGLNPAVMREIAHDVIHRHLRPDGDQREHEIPDGPSL